LASLSIDAESAANPAAIYAALLVENGRRCSVRTMHRVQAENSEAQERRNQPQPKPEVSA
jgi:hypothetical protein